MAKITIEDQAREVIAEHSKSFAFAAKLLPKETRDAASILYAWCRRADDAIDENKGKKQKEALAMLQSELIDIYENRTSYDSPAIIQAFGAICQKYHIPRHYPEELLKGMAMDVEERDYKTLEDLLHYCYRVASTVGLMMCHIMGVSDKKALEHAAHLGIAMQLTNICRDIKEDWERDRVYIPTEMLPDGNQIIGEAIRTPHSQSVSEVAKTVERLLRIAEQYYQSADLGIKYLPYAPSIAISTARHVYHGIGTEIKARQYDSLQERCYVKTGKKFELAGYALRYVAEVRLRLNSAPFKKVDLTQSVYTFENMLEQKRINQAA